MAEQKYTLILLLAGCFIASATACNQTLVNECLADSSLGNYGFPVILDVPVDDLDDFCGNRADFSTCIDGFPRENCNFDETKEYEPYESMAEFICGDRTAYETHYEVVNNASYRLPWRACDNTFSNLGEGAENGCDVLDELVTCYQNEITEESTEAQTYIGNFVTKAYEYYDTHYQCTAGSSTVRITSSLMIMSLLAYLWSTFH